MHALTKSMIKNHKLTDFNCSCCGKKLNPETMTWLELNKATGKYSKVGTVAEADSQGCFEFGQACANRKLAE